MKSYIYLLGCLVLMTVLSCDKLDEYLDKSPTGGITEIQLFENYNRTESFISAIYTQIISEWFPSGVNDPTFTLASASDEATTSVRYQDGPHEFTEGLISPHNSRYDMWEHLYGAIRACNLFLENIENLSPSDAAKFEGKNRMIGEAHFLRGWFYMDLLKRYGGVPIVDRVLNLSDNLNLPRNSAEQVADFISQDCDLAAAILPSSRVQSSIHFGRPTRGSALMLKSQALLLVASKLHNPDNKIEAWQKAADAAKAVIDLNDYEVDDDYKRLFHKRFSKSVIFQQNTNYINWHNRNPPPSFKSYGRVQPLQNLVDDYEMQATGKKINEPNSGYDPSNPYEGRDPRFYYSILYDGCSWKGRVINTYVGSGEDAIQPEGGGFRTQTGYYLAKTVDETADNYSNNPGEHYWIYMRYEEALLNYAEAMNEVLDTPDASVYNAINSIRTRPGINMPPLPEGISKDEMRERIRSERRIELAFEGKRFWDIRRWRIGEDVMKLPYGCLIEKQSESQKTYTKFLIRNQIYRPAFDLFPILQSVINKQPALEQNPGYDNQ